MAMAGSGKRFETDHKRGTSTVVLRKRCRKNNSDSHSDPAIQWVNSHLQSVQANVGHPREYSLDHNVHANILQLPLQPGILTKESLHDYFQRTSWNTTFPVPLIAQFAQEGNPTEECDSMLRLIKAKKSYLNTLNSIKASFRRKKVSKKIGKKLPQENIFPNVVFKLAEQLERDPDKWFLGKYGYDYYFTGGSLIVVVTKDLKWIVNVVDETMHTVKIIPIHVLANKLQIDSNNIKEYDLGSDYGPILETFWNAADKFNTVRDQAIEFSNIIIGLRRKHQINILCGKGDPATLTQRTITSEVPFISCCFVFEFNQRFICTSDMEKNLKIWNYNQIRILCSLKLPKQDPADDDWCCIRYVGRSTVICLERTNVRLVKITPNDMIIEKTVALASWLWSCDRASCLEVNTEERIIFIGTTHKLLLLRIVESADSESSDLQQIITFTHNLKHFPTMMQCVSESHQNYYVWISSHLPGDTKICSFAKLPPKRFATKNLPVKPRSIQESYIFARNEGKCVFPARVLSRRLQLFHSGIAIIKDSDQLYLLLQNSIGDIFHQKIIHDRNESNSSEVASSMHNWMLQVNSFNASLPSRTTATDLKNLRGFKKILQSRTNWNSPAVESQENKQTFRKRPRWKQTVEQLHEYRDLLAPDMLSVWGFRPNVAQSEQRLATDIPINVTDRISSWLEQTAELAATFTVRTDVAEEVPDTQAAVISDDDNSSVEIAAVSSSMKFPVPMVSTTDTLKDKVKLDTNKTSAKPVRKKYVQGF
ncbi:uncharacterized protein LOC129726428 [Wyeomyia smithii]|uniref:uncharacterized protein LOC129726428 n=1 Tax=Wyeomyia smithii TaxID=174621 RepID=UPI002467C695|nr:uncharacterized protein LOC129726428 [Wyeomyia smithii]